ncbi:MAG: hypothetical protein OQK68_03425 [Sedimenticola sp.]|nr:hypothetical protein [Sedimenticola sp.]MCW8948114.1 hypothetical protein [Sedimenticola sp.]
MKRRFTEAYKAGDASEGAISQYPESPLWITGIRDVLLISRIQLGMKS